MNHLFGIVIIRWILYSGCMNILLIRNNTVPIQLLQWQTRKESTATEGSEVVFFWILPKMFKERQMMHEDIIPGSQKSAFVKIINIIKEMVQTEESDSKSVSWSNTTIHSMFELVRQHLLYVYNATKSTVFEMIYKVVMTNYSLFPLLLINASVICANTRERYLMPINISLNLSRQRISSVKLCYDASENSCFLIIRCDDKSEF